MNKAMRYVAGTPQECIDNQGNQFYHGVNEYKPRTEGRTAQSAQRKYDRLYGGERQPQRIWDRDEARYVTTT